MQRLGRTIFIAVSLACSLTVVLVTIAFAAFYGCARTPQPTDTWRDGFCIYTCEPINGPALDHEIWRQDNGRWLCRCSDGHVYMIPG